MKYETLKIEIADRVARVTLNRPEMFNAINLKMRQELSDVLDELEKSNDVRAVLMTGAGKAFCAGGDVTDQLKDPASLDKGQLAELLRPFNQLVLRMWRFEKPLISAVNGVAAGGGCCLAMCSDVRIASENARFVFLFVKRGLSAADMGTTWILPRLVGFGRAAELLYTGDPVNARDALSMGLVNRVVAPEKLLEESEALAKKIALGPPIGLKMTKRILLYGQTSDLASHLEFESALQTFLLDTHDFAEGIKSFNEKREPKFEGK